MDHSRRLFFNICRDENACVNYSEKRGGHGMRNGISMLSRVEMPAISTYPYKLTVNTDIDCASFFVWRMVVHSMTYIL